MQGSLKFDLPLRALAVAFVFTALISLINLGSAVALNAIFSLSNSALITSYTITIGCAIYRRLQGHELPPARYSLGKYGLAINIISIILLLPIYVFVFFPLLPLPGLTLAYMNWGIVMYGGVIIFSTVYYIIWGRHTFISPRENIAEVAEAMNRFYNVPETKGVLEDSQEIKDEHE
jgi:amino acid transporter